MRMPVVAGARVFLRPARPGPGKRGAPVPVQRFPAHGCLLLKRNRAHGHSGAGHAYAQSAGGASKRPVLVGRWARHSAHLPV